MLENILRNDEDACADWMWAHRRWRSMLCMVDHCLNLAQKKNFLDASLRVAGLTALPRRQPYCLRLPDDPTLARIAAQWIERLREARPDVRWIVLSPTACADLFHEGANCERLVAFEPGKIRVVLKTLRGEWPEIYLSLDPSANSVAEAVACRASRSMGLSVGKRRGIECHSVLLIDPVRIGADTFDAVLSEEFHACGMGREAE